MEFDYTLYHPFVLICSGGTQSGKSTLIAELIRRKDEVIHPLIQKVLYCYSETEPEFAKELRNIYGSRIEFCHGLEIDIPEGNTIPTLLVLDDLMDEISKSKEMGQLVTKGSHHRSLSIIICLQNFFFRNFRTITLNAKYIVLFKNVRDNSVINYIGRQMNQGKRYSALEQCYEDATRNKPYSYLFIDVSQNQMDNCRFRSSIFPDSNCVVYMIK
jgi:hypothetical protein